MHIQDITYYIQYKTYKEGVRCEVLSEYYIYLLSELILTYTVDFCKITRLPLFT